MAVFQYMQSDWPQNLLCMLMRYNWVWSYRFSGDIKAIDILPVCGLELNGDWISLLINICGVLSHTYV